MASVLPARFPGAIRLGLRQLHLISFDEGLGDITRAQGAAANPLEGSPRLRHSASVTAVAALLTTAPQETPMRPNRLRQRLDAGEPMLGTHIHLAWRALAEPIV